MTDHYLVLDDAYAASWSPQATFQGGPVAYTTHPVGSIFWHDDALWKIDQISVFWGSYLFYCIRQRSYPDPVWVDPEE